MNIYNRHVDEFSNFFHFVADLDPKLMTNQSAIRSRDFGSDGKTKTNRESHRRALKIINSQSVMLFFSYVLLLGS